MAHQEIFYKAGFSFIKKCVKKHAQNFMTE
jgi:hypothetical protein